MSKMVHSWGVFDAGCWLAAQLGCRLEPLHVSSPPWWPLDGKTYMGTWLFPEQTSGENQAEAPWPFWSSLESHQTYFHHILLVNQPHAHPDPREDHLSRKEHQRIFSHFFKTIQGYWHSPQEKFKSAWFLCGKVSLQEWPPLTPPPAVTLMSPHSSNVLLFPLPLNLGQLYQYSMW